MSNNLSFVNTSYSWVKTNDYSPTYFQPQALPHWEEVLNYKVRFSALLRLNRYDKKVSAGISMDI